MKDLLFRQQNKLNVLAICTLTLCTRPASAEVGFADVAIDFFDSGAGPIPGPYGGTYPGGPGFPISVSLDVLFGDDPGPTGYDDFVSLPTNSFITLGFVDETIVDGPGNDFALEMPDGPGEMASVFVSSNEVDFTFIGTAVQPTEGGFDLGSIGFADPVHAIKIVGLDDAGPSPGFDLYHVSISHQSIGPPSVPEPSTAFLTLVGGLSLVLQRHRFRG